MEFMDVIAKRRSVRSYQNKPIDKATIEQLIDAAIQAPTGMNTQPWAFGVIQDADLLRQYSGQIKQTLLSTTPDDSPLARYREMWADPDFHVFYDAPTLIVIFGRPISPIAEADCCLAAENLLLAATDKGLGTCWIGFAWAFLNQPEIKAQLGIPEDYKAIAPIIVGHPSEPAPPVERNPAEIVFWK